MDTETRVFINVAGTPIGCIQHLSSDTLQEVPVHAGAPFPALKELVLEGSFSKLERFRLEHVDLSGKRFKLAHLGQSGGMYQHEVIWVGHKRGEVGMAIWFGE